jgi:hypothetical protein
MKHLLKLTLAIFLLSIGLQGLSAQAKKKKTFETPPQKNIVKLNLSPLFLLTGSVSYERKLADNFSADVGFFYTKLNYKRIGYNGWGLTPGVRCYFTPTALNGFYITPFFRHTNLDLTLDLHDLTSVIGGDVGVKLNTYGGGFVLGGQIISKGGFTFDAFIGPHIYTGIPKLAADVDPAIFDEIPDNELITIAEDWIINKIERGTALGAFTAGGIRSGICIGFAF